MKKFVVVMLALFLALPALSFAGSATSRYDVTIGGAININGGYSSQNAHEGSFVASRESSAARKNLLDENGNTYFSAADTNVNFRIKGPDAWGAKTSGFMLLDFRGTNSGNAFGGAQIKHGVIDLDWANANLKIGKTFQQFGEVWGRALIVGGDFGQFWNGGALPYQIALRYKWTKGFSTMFGIIQPTEWQQAVRSWNDGYARNGLPYLQYDVEWGTDACGKVGPHGLKFSLGGLIGQEKKSIQDINATKWKDDTVPVWATILRGFVPIIPEKKENKSNAMYFTGNAFIGQNPQGRSSAWLGTTGANGFWISNGSYWRPMANNLANAAVPTYFGGMLQLTYYLTNQTWINAQYGYIKYNYSSYARQTAALAAGLGTNEFDWKGRDLVNMQQQYGLSIFHDPSPNLRLAFMWYRMFNTFNGYSPNDLAGATVSPSAAANLNNWGVEDRFKFGAIYFF